MAWANGQIFIFVKCDRFAGGQIAQSRRHDGDKKIKYITNEDSGDRHSKIYRCVRRVCLCHWHQRQEGRTCTIVVPTTATSTSSLVDNLCLPASQRERLCSARSTHVSSQLITTRNYTSVCPALISRADISRHYRISVESTGVEHAENSPRVLMRTRV